MKIKLLANNAFINAASLILVFLHFIAVNRDVIIDMSALSEQMEDITNKRLVNPKN